MDNEDVERYRKLLHDWKPGPSQPVKSPLPPRARAGSASSRASEPPRPNPPPTPPADSYPGRLTYAPGAILLCNERSLVIYKRPVPDKEYHLVCTLLPRGAVRSEGIALEGHKVEEIGSLPTVWFEKLQAKMSWSRDLIVFHCYRFEDAPRIPEHLGSPTWGAEPVTNGATESKAPEPMGTMSAYTPAPATEPAPAETPQPNGVLRRGQRIMIRFGQKMWDAIYWGKDEQGQVVAHRTNQTWALMHLDLDRFGEGLQVDPEPNSDLVAEIARALTAG